MGQTQQQRAKVLLVDDDEGARTTLDAILSEEFDVVVAPSVREATAVLSRERVDVLVTDYQMADGTGARLLDLVRRDYPAVATILMTGHANSAEVRELQKSSKVLVLFKPVSPGDVVGWVRNGVSMSRLTAATSRLREKTDGLKLRRDSRGPAAD